MHNQLSSVCEHLAGRMRQASGELVRILKAQTA